MTSSIVSFCQGLPLVQVSTSQHIWKLRFHFLKVLLYNIFISHFTIIIIWCRQGTSTKLIYSFRRKMIAICKTQININLNDSLATRTQPMVNGPCNFFPCFNPYTSIYTTCIILTKKLFSITFCLLSIVNYFS